MATLIGFVMEPVGMEYELATAQPVVQDVAGSVLVGGYDGWFPEDALKLADDELAGVYWVPLSRRRSIQVGQAVWVMGSNAHQSILGVVGDGGLRRQIARWVLAETGVLWEVGTQRAFQDLSEAISVASRQVIKQWLAGVAAEARGREALRLYATMESTPDAERLPLLGVVARRDLDDRALHTLRQEFNAVVPWPARLVSPFGVRVRQLERQISRRASAGRVARRATVTVFSHDEVLVRNANRLVRRGGIVDGNATSLWHPYVARADYSMSDRLEFGTNTYATASSDAIAEVENYANGSAR
jgi:hypothetical protein